MALAGLGVLTSDAFASQFDDDSVKSELGVLSSAAWFAYLVAAISVVCAGLGIYGAWKYKGWMVLVSGVWYAINALLSLIGGGVGGCIMSAFFAYPHFVFYREMQQNIMTADNYHNEKHCCCGMV